jgi:hypothetical protein
LARTAGDQACLGVEAGVTGGTLQQRCGRFATHSRRPPHCHETWHRSSRSKPPMNNDRSAT